MKKKIKYFRPNKIITLIDLTKGDYPYGTLIFHPQFTSQPDSLIDFGLLFRFILTNISEVPYKVIALNIISTLFIVIALLGVASFAYPYLASQINNFTPKNNTNAALISPTAAPSPEVETTEFSLSIPKINLQSDISPNVDITKEDLYKGVLKDVGVAHAKGSKLPGEKGPIFLFAHSTDSILHVAEYNAKFFSLPDVSQGDDINISYHGKKYSYRIGKKIVIDPTDLDVINNSGSALILMTCTPPGTTWKRLIVFADQV